MKTAVYYTIALACCLGLALADWDAQGYGSSYGYGGYGGGLGGYGKATYVPVYPGAAKGGAGGGGIIALIGMLFLLFFIFGNNSGAQDQIVLINSTLEG